MSQSKIVDIPLKMEKYYGKGKILHPSISAIQDLIRHIPKGKIVTIPALREKLAANYGTTTTCPIRTGNMIKKIAENYSYDNVDDKMPFWRVVRGDKMLIKFNNVEFWAAKIGDEGFQLTLTKSDAIKVRYKPEEEFKF